MLDHVGEVVDRHLEVPVEHARVVARVLLAGEGVDITAHRIEALCDVQRRPRRGSLEEQVLEEMARAADPVRLIARAGQHPEAHRDGADAWHPLRDDPKARSELGPSDGHPGFAYSPEPVASGPEPGAGVAREAEGSRPPRSSRKRRPPRRSPRSPRSPRPPPPRPP